MRPAEPARRVDVLDAGRDRTPLLERYRALTARLRLAVAATAVAVLALGAGVQQEAERRHAARDAVVDLDAHLLRTDLVTDRQTLGFALLLRNRGPAPVHVQRGHVGVAGVGLLDARLDDVVLQPGQAAGLVVQWGFPQCGVLAGGSVEDTALVLDVRTADAATHRARVPVPDVAPERLLTSVGCPLSLTGRAVSARSGGSR